MVWRFPHHTPGYLIQRRLERLVVVHRRLLAKLPNEDSPQPLVSVSLLSPCAHCVFLFDVWELNVYAEYKTTSAGHCCPLDILPRW